MWNSLPHYIFRGCAQETQKKGYRHGIVYELLSKYKMRPVLPNISMTEGLGSLKYNLYNPTQVLFKAIKRTWIRNCVSFCVICYFFRHIFLYCNRLPEFVNVLLANTFYFNANLFAEYFQDRCWNATLLIFSAFRYLRISVYQDKKYILLVQGLRWAAMVVLLIQFQGYRCHPFC